MRQQNYVKAISCFNSLIKKNIRLPESYLNIAKCYFKLGNLAEVKINLHKALDLKYSNDFTHRILEITNWKMLASYNYFNNWPVFSPDGRTLAYVSARQDTNKDGKIDALDCGGIFLVDIDTGNEKCVVLDNYFNSQPVFSSDGRKLVYLSVRKHMQDDSDIVDHQANPGLYMLDLETMREVELLDDSYRAKHCTFTPDGKKLIFSCWRPRDSNSAIYEYDIHNHKMEVLVTSNYENTFPSVSNNGKRLVFSAWRRDTNKDGLVNIRDNSGIYIKDLDYGVESIIASDEYNNAFPTFSPDGNKILFLSVRNDTNEDGVINSLDNPGIYIYDLIREKERCVVSDEHFNKFASFTPDGRGVVFLSSWRGASVDREVRDYFENKGIYMLSLSNGLVKQVVSDKHYGCRYPVISPDGDKVTYISWRKNTNRGIFLADLNRLPDREELHKFIDENL